MTAVVEDRTVLKEIFADCVRIWKFSAPRFSEKARQRVTLDEVLHTRHARFSIT